MKATPTAIIGLVIGIIGAALLGLFVASSTDSGIDTSSGSGATVAVLVAAVDLPADVEASALSSEQVRVQQVPEDVVPSTAVTDLALLGPQRTIRPVGAGEIISRSQFGIAGPSAGGFIVEEGYEAVAVEAALPNGVEGYVTPGTRVNVYSTLATTNSDTGTTRTYTQLVMGHVNVLAVTRGLLDGTSQATSGTTPGTIVLVLEVRTEDAPVLIYAEQNGELWYSIVNDDDPAPPVTQIELTDLSPAAREAAIAAAIAEQDARDAARDAADEAASAAAQSEAPTSGDDQ